MDDRNPVQTIPRLTVVSSTGPLSALATLQVGKRQHQRASVRQTLYLGTLSATRCNPVIRSFYERLRGCGKTAKVALTACMRKLLTILNAMLKHGTPWHPKAEGGLLTFNTVAPPRRGGASTRAGFERVDV